MNANGTVGVNMSVISVAVNTTVADEEVTTKPRWVPFAEPVPDWEEASEKWGIWWFIHIYGVGAMYFLISIFTGANIVALAVAKKLPQKAYYVTLNILVFLFSVERGVFMFLDAYNIKGTLPPFVAYLFLSIGLPCMSSAFYLIFMAWCKATKMQKTNRVHKTSTMVVIIVLHFVVSLAFDLVAGFTLHAIILLIICQVCFVIFGFALSIVYFYLYRRIYVTTVASRRSLMRMSQNTNSPYGQDEYDIYANGIHNNPKDLSPTSDDSGNTNESTPPSGVFANSITEPITPKTNNENNARGSGKGSKARRLRNRSSIPDVKVPLGAKLILATAILLFIIACLYLAGIFFCYTLQILTNTNPEPWSWWGYELALRLCEIALCWTISLAATRPITRRLAKQVSIRTLHSRRKLVNSVSEAGEAVPKNIV